ncbi:MAG: carboxylesterase/lipase family protein [Acetobacteraceae bacterium]|nr:carboxylesterase/lipase family protein [Acetobacteraceae bacterium]MSP30885.1 carboxylesterase/lipase family protein [Acetobacteraceae bacterium]
MISETLAEIPTGKLRGSIIEGTAAFKAIPYGASTSGANRFLPPQKPTPWAGIRDAIEYRGQSPQSRYGMATRAELQDFAGIADAAPETEDCLTLNVWTKSCTGRRAVMVWFHGGAFASGSANSPRLQGSRLARRGDVVVVTVNQRLNIFGHLDLSASGADFAQSGNAGTLDMIAALYWVRDNISLFGGDPNNVTIFGESGGGAKVCTLLAMPAAVGLFHRAIVQSGAAIRLREPERAQRLTDVVLATLGLKPGDTRQLQALTIPQLQAAIGPATKTIGPAQFPFFDRYPFGPTVDGDLLPAHPFHQGAPAISQHIPLIIGDTKDEAAWFLASDDAWWNRNVTEDQLRARVSAIAGTHTDRVMELYRRLAPNASPSDRLTATLTDANFRIRSLTLANHRAHQNAAPLWMYSFAYESPRFDGRMKSSHALDVPFTFDTIDLTNITDISPTAHGVADAMSGTWAAFARTGIPHHGGIPPWPTYNLETRATLVLSPTNYITQDPGAETRALWQEIAGA